MAKRDSRTRTSDPLGDVSDAVFGRNRLIGFAALMLLALSGFATWSGMNDFIVGVSQTSNTSRGPAGLTVSNEWLVIAITVALTFLMWLALRETFGKGRLRTHRFATGLLYTFLALWSVGFGYGFWWSLIAGEEATRTSLTGLQEDARGAAGSIAARLDAVRVQIDSVASWSETQMAREETSGGSCGIRSGAGRGPLYNARVGVRDAITTLRDNVTKSWVGPVQSDVNQLRRSATRLEGENVADRQQSFEQMAQNIRTRARSIADRSNEFGKTVSAEMNALADTVSVAPGEAGFSCYDPTLAQRLRLAADQAGQPAVLTLRDAAFNEGPAGVANAVKGMWESIGSGVAGGVRYVLSGFSAQPGETSAPSSFTGRDLIALLATLGVDIGLFVLTALNPPMRIPDRLTGDARRQIRDAVMTAAQNIPGDDNADINWIRRHFINHDVRLLYRGEIGSIVGDDIKDAPWSEAPSGWFRRTQRRRNATWLVIPNLYSATTSEKERALALNHLAGVLGDLGFVRWPTRHEYLSLRAEERGDSITDLSNIRKIAAEKQNLEGERRDEIDSAVAERNHGLFSKAQKTLEFNGWSPGAQSDIELFKLTDKDGLTPLLDVLNDVTLLPAETDEA
ncbi:MAG: hypothetical protein AAGJ70_10290 [Pseudomonadota bacterium]